MKYIKLYDDYDIDKIIRHYEYPLYSRSGNDYRRMGWYTKEGQYKRFKIMSKYVKNGDSILDYGSGLGNLVDYFRTEKRFFNRRKITYTGVDINKKFVEETKEIYDDEYFYHINNYKDVYGRFDWFLASGAFSVYTSTKDFYETIDYFYKKVNKGLSFNLLDEISHNSEPTDISNNMSVRSYKLKEVYDYFKNLYGKVRVVSFTTSKIKDEYNIYIFK